MHQDRNECHNNNGDIRTNHALLNLIWDLEKRAREEVTKSNDRRTKRTDEGAEVSVDGTGTDDRVDSPLPYCGICDTGRFMRRDDASGFSGVCVRCGTVEQHREVVTGPVAATRHSGGDDAESGRSLRDRSGPGGRCVVDCLLPISSMGTRTTDAARRERGRGKSRRRWAKYAAIVHDRSRMPYAERARYHVFREIDRLVNALMGETCVELNASVCKIAHDAYSRTASRRDNKVTRGAARKALIAYCVYRACVDINAPRRVGEIAAVARLTGKQIGDAHKKVMWTMADNNNKTSRTTDDITANEPITASHLVARMCARLADVLTGAQIRRISADARKILDTLPVDRVPELCGRSPSSLAVGAIACAAAAAHHSHVSRVLTKRVIAAAAGSSVVTATKMQHLIQSHLNNNV